MLLIDRYLAAMYTFVNCRNKSNSVWCKLAIYVLWLLLRQSHIGVHSYLLTAILAIM